MVQIAFHSLGGSQEKGQDLINQGCPSRCDTNNWILLRLFFKTNLSL